MLSSRSAYKPRVRFRVYTTALLLFNLNTQRSNAKQSDMLYNSNISHGEKQEEYLPRANREGANCTLVGWEKRVCLKATVKTGLKF